MKIGNPADKPALSPVTPGRNAPAETEKVPGGAPAEASAQVELSNAATTLLSNVQASSPEFDAEKVARISKAIEDGTFKVNHEAIADKLIANAQEVLGKTSTS